MADKTLLAIVELGGYPDFSPLYRVAGYAVTVVSQMRKALKTAKQLQPDVIVAEFNYQPDFRERVSNLEPLLAVLQNLPHTRVLVFYEAHHQVQLAKLQSRFAGFEALPYPVDEARLRAWLAGEDTSLPRSASLPLS